MNERQNNSTALKLVYWPFVLLSLLAGILISWPALSGDALGRVNIMYLLLLYFVVPIVSLFSTIISWLTGSNVHSGYWLTRFGNFSFLKSDFFRTLRQQNLDKLWLLQQSQLIAVSFAVASLVVFLFLLVFTDLSFVWRSTLLTPENIYPMLQWVAKPWQFWSGAQPSLELLAASQEYRLNQTAQNPQSLANWWTFILAVQLFYSFILRSIIFSALTVQLKQRLKNNDGPVTDFITKVNQESGITKLEAVPLSKINHHRPVVLWDNIAHKIADKLFPESTQSYIVIDTWTGDQTQINQLREINEPIIVVKAWEPPMAELADQVAINKGYILPLNWNEHGLIAIEPIAHDEWARFCTENKCTMVLAEVIDDE